MCFRWSICGCFIRYNMLRRSFSNAEESCREGELLSIFYYQSFYNKISGNTYLNKLSIKITIKVRHI